jgi:outer membrane immunogenic protein
MTHPSILATAALITGLGVGAVQAADWSGLYLGGHLGTARTSGSFDAFTPNNSFNGFDLQGMNGSAMLGGLQLGYNWDMGSYVVGIEGSFSAMGLSKGSVTSQDRGTVPQFNREVDNLLLLTPRIGFEVGDALIYAKAGLAATRIGATHDQDGDMISGGGTETGWAVGIGAEFPIAERLTARIDLTHADFGSTRQDMPGAGSNDDIWTTQKLKTQLITVGFNYRF